MAASPQIQQAVINKLQEGSCRPTELLKFLLDEGFTEADIREAVSQLLNETKIELTDQRVLQTQVVAA